MQENAPHEAGDEKKPPHHDSGAAGLIPSFSAFLFTNTKYTQRKLRGLLRKSKTFGMSFLVDGIRPVTKMLGMNFFEHYLTEEEKKEIEKKLPNGVTIDDVVRLSDGYYYREASTGNLIKIR